MNEALNEDPWLNVDEMQWRSRDWRNDRKNVGFAQKKWKRNLLARCQKKYLHLPTRDPRWSSCLPVTGSLHACMVSAPFHINLNADVSMHCALLCTGSVCNYLIITVLVAQELISLWNVTASIGFTQAHSRHFKKWPINKITFHWLCSVLSEEGGQWEQVRCDVCFVCAASQTHVFSPKNGTICCMYSWAFWNTRPVRSFRTKETGLSTGGIVGFSLGRLTNQQTGFIQENNLPRKWHARVWTILEPENGPFIRLIPGLTPYLKLSLVISWHHSSSAMRSLFMTLQDSVIKSLNAPLGVCDPIRRWFAELRFSAA